MAKQTKTIALSLDELEDKEEQLRVEYPFVERVMHDGLCEFVEELLEIYRPDLDTKEFGDFIEAIIDRLENQMTLIEEETHSGVYNEYSQSEIFSISFLMFLEQVFDKILDALRNVFINDQVAYVPNSIEQIRKNTIIFQINL